MSDLLRTRPASTAEMIAIFSDFETIGHALAFETAFAKAKAAVGLIPDVTADLIGEACSTIAIDPAELAREAALAGTLAIPLVARVRAVLPADAAEHFHKGATSQDVADTVLMLQSVRAGNLLEADVRRINSGLRTLVQRYATTPAVGRTLLQDALPVGFGLRLAHAAIGIDQAARRLDADLDGHARLQFGGAAGTRAGLDENGEAITRHMAASLGLVSGVPWHAQRLGVAAIATSLGLLIGAVGKLARDVSLLAQNAIGEAREPLILGRGGSSAMTHKRNPTACQVALSAAIRAPGLVATILGGMAQEEERGLGGWQAETPVLADLFLLAAGSVSAMAEVALGLDIDEVAISRNLMAANFGADIGESGAIAAAILAVTARD